ncbi:MAG: hypothetical protein GC204_13515 [Chloroflexi bacterium]|nr:hypothetical protein [Chloroflexota bacterium]
MTIVVFGAAVVLSVLIGAALVIGRSQPASQRVERLHLLDCAPPCWNEITPRVSSRGELEQQMAATFPDYRMLGMNSSLPFLIWTWNSISIDVAIDDGIVNSLGMGSELALGYMPRLGEVLAVFGSPRCVKIGDMAVLTTFYYENAAHESIIQITTKLASVFEPIVSIDFGVYKLSGCPKDSMSWQDFRRSQAAFFSAS